MTARLVDPQDVIRCAPVGSCVYSLARIDAGAEEVDFLIREETARVQAWQSPAIEFRMAVLEERGVLLVPVMIRVGVELYECWINHHAEDAKTSRVLGTLAIQERLVLHCWGDAGARIRSLAVSNPHGATWAEAAHRCAAAPPWSMRAFDVARDAVYRRHPTVMQLWSALGEGRTG